MHFFFYNFFLQFFAPKIGNFLKFLVFTTKIRLILRRKKNRKFLDITKLEGQKKFFLKKSLEVTGSKFNKT